MRRNVTHPLIVLTTAATLLLAGTLAPVGASTAAEGAASATAQDAEGATPSDRSPPEGSADDEDGGLAYLVPELDGAGFKISDGPRRFENCLGISPAVGRLGTEELFVLRLGYNPNAWLGYEISLGHNAASSLHAMIHTFNIVLRYPLPWRVQPYGTAGYGMMTVYPGRAVEADPVTKNIVTYGGGLELYMRDDIALRGEIRAATVFGQELNREGTVAYTYREYTIGFAFYRNLGN